MHVQSNVQPYHLLMDLLRFKIQVFLPFFLELICEIILIIKNTKYPFGQNYRFAFILFPNKIN